MLRLGLQKNYFKNNFMQTYLSEKVTGAVVTVPASFQENQIAATKRAVELAGLELKHLLKEPTSVAIAYNHKKKLGNSKILIFDFGGGCKVSLFRKFQNVGTLDISIAEVKDKNLEVKAVTGNIHLGKILKLIDHETLMDSFRWSRF